jgi:hypothetical protein
LLENAARKHHVDGHTAQCRESNWLKFDQVFSIAIPQPQRKMSGYIE